MKRYAIIALTFSAMVLVQSCHHFTLSDANQLQKGMVPSEVLNFVSKGPRDIFKNSTLNVEVQVYQIVIGDYSSHYYVAYKAGKLLYWGYPYEFARHNDPFINDVGTWVANEVKKS